MMRVTIAGPQRPIRAFSLTSLALAVSLAFISPGHAADTTTALNKVLQGAGISQHDAATIRESITSGDAQSRLPATHHNFFADQLRRYGMDEEARLFLEGEVTGGSDTEGPNQASAVSEELSASPSEMSAPTAGASTAVSRSTSSSAPATGSRSMSVDSQDSTDGNAGRPAPALTEAEVPDVRPGVAPDERTLALLVNQIMRGESLTSDQRDTLHRGLADSTLNRMIPADRHDDFINQLNRYGMEEEAAMFQAGNSSQRDLLARLPGTPRPIYERDYMEEYLQGVEYFSNELDQRVDRRRGSQLIVVDYDDRIMRIDDPLAGGTLERVASSCLLNSGRAPGAGAPPQTYGTDMLVFERPVKGRVRIEERTDGGYITTYLNYSVQRYAVSWSEQSGSTLPAYFYGGQIRQQYDDEGRKNGTRIDPPKWHRYHCSVRNIDF